MKRIALVLALMASIACLSCGGWRSATKTKTPDPPSKASVQEKAPPTTDKSAAGPEYEPPGPTSTDKLSDGGIDPKERDDVRQAALDFARKNVPDVKHIKICYSKLYGGWYMLLYVEKGKKLSMQHWSWNAKSKEWEIVYQQKNMSPKQLDFDLKGEVTGEKCYVLQ